jgi:hypothetical protein
VPYGTCDLAADAGWCRWAAMGHRRVRGRDPAPLVER